MPIPRTPIRNVSLLTIGNAIGYGLTILLLPFLTRSYSPAEFGSFALLFGLTQIGGLASTLRLEKAIFISSSPAEAQGIKHSAYLSCIISSLLSGLLVLTYLTLTGQLGTLIYLPLTIASQGCILIETASGNHSDRYARSAIARGLQGAGAGIFALILSGYSQEGLIYGFVSSQLLVAAFLWFSRSEKTHPLNRQSYRSGIKYLRKHHKFARFTAPHEIAGALSAQATTFLIPLYFGTTLAGLYFIAQKCVMLPSVLLGSSTAQVYYHELGKVRENRDQRIQLFNTTLQATATASIAIFAIVYVFAPAAVTFIFGEAWLVAGDYGRILAPWAVVHLLGSILSQTPQALNSQKTAMLLELANSSIRIGLLTVGYVFGNAALGILLFISASIAFTGGRLIWYSRLIHKP